MRLGSRKSKIISELLNSDSYITGQYLANILGVTSRTIRGDIGELNDELFEERIQILSSAGQGYYIDKGHKDRLSKIISIQQDYIVPILPDTRAEHILKQLILNPKGISTDTISNELYVSKSTLDRDLIKVKKDLRKNNLNIIKNSANNICISGEELLIRNIYISYFEKAVKSHSTDMNLLNDETLDIISKARQIVYGILESDNIDLTGDEFDAAAVLLTVVMFRDSYGFMLDRYEQCGIDNKAIEEIVKKIKYDINLNRYEEEYIKDWLNKLMLGNAAEEDLKDIKELIQKGMDDVSRTFDYTFDGKLNDQLVTLLTSAQIRSSEYSLNDIKKEYPQAVEMAVSLIKFINHKYSIEICDEILVKIVLLFVCEMEKDILSKELKRRDVVIVCQSGELVRNLIKSRLMRHFPGFNILGFFPLYRVNEAIELKPDLIISTVMIESEEYPVIVINPLFKDYDVLKINTAIRQIEHTESVSYEFLNLFKEDLFIKDIETNDRYEAIKTLSDTLTENGYSKEGFYQAVVERENISSTAIGNMVAVPHAVGNDYGENVVAIGILKKPIDWNDEKVQLIFLINIKNASAGTVKQIFKSFFNLISSKGKVERIIKSKNYYEFLKTMNQ